MINTELTGTTEKIEHMELAAAALTDFQKSLRKQKDVLTEFEPQTWYSLVDYATVYARDDIRFTFKNGTEIKA